MKNRYPLTQRNKRISDWIKGLQGQPGWESLLECLEQIAEGQDANKVLGLNRGRGKNAKQAVATFKKNMIPIWVASVMRELQVSRSEAMEKASLAWDMDYETVERYAQRLDAVLNEGGNFDYQALLPMS
jgi:hypothetical protein